MPVEIEKIVRDGLSLYPNLSREEYFKQKVFTEKEVRAIFDKFDEFACIKDDDWYKDCKKKILESD